MNVFRTVSNCFHIPWFTRFLRHEVFTFLLPLNCSILLSVKGNSQLLSPYVHSHLNGFYYLFLIFGCKAIKLFVAILFDVEFVYSCFLPIWNLDPCKNNLLHGYKNLVILLLSISHLLFNFVISIFSYYGRNYNLHQLISFPNILCLTMNYPCQEQSLRKA